MSYTASQIERLTTAADLPDRLREAMRAGERSSPRGVRLSPQLSYGRHVGPTPHTARAAAVLLLLFRRQGRWHLPLTERPQSLAHHGGQMSLPGGAIEPGETSQAAALRELDEELGIGGDVAPIGQLADCYVFASDFLITPWIAAANFEPQWRPHAYEVQSVVELPLDVLLDERAIGRLTIERGPLAFHAPCIRVGSARVWGATSIILGELADVLRNLLEDF
jgi:8-oxo-dGTP pyrophosphatase MutT (NUDIX family)